MIEEKGGETALNQPCERTDRSMKTTQVTILCYILLAPFFPRSHVSATAALHGKTGANTLQRKPAPVSTQEALGEGRCEDGLLLLLMEGADADSGGGQRRPADQPELRRTQDPVQPG